MCARRSPIQRLNLVSLPTRQLAARIQVLESWMIVICRGWRSSIFFPASCATQTLKDLETFWPWLGLVAFTTDTEPVVCSSDNYKELECNIRCFLPHTVKWLPLLFVLSLSFSSLPWYAQLPVCNKRFVEVSTSSQKKGAPPGH